MRPSQKLFHSEGIHLKKKKKKDNLENGRKQFQRTQMTGPNLQNIQTTYITQQQESQ